jgi:hypothetical protein
VTFAIFCSKCLLFSFVLVPEERREIICTQMPIDQEQRFLRKLGGVAHAIISDAVLCVCNDRGLDDLEYQIVGTIFSRVFMIGRLNVNFYLCRHFPPSLLPPK